MRVILLSNIKSLGKAGDVVEASAGYARNFLLPKKLAIEASEIHLHELEHKKAKQLLMVEKEKKNIGLLTQALTNKTFVIKKKVGEKEKLLGSVTSKDIQEEIRKIDIELDKKFIITTEPIKTLGEHLVTVKLTAGEGVLIKVIVVAE